MVLDRTVQAVDEQGWGMQQHQAWVWVLSACVAGRWRSKQKERHKVEEAPGRKTNKV